MSFSHFLALALLFISFFVSTARAENEAQFPEANSIKIGAILSLSGDCADVGELTRKGLELASSEINSHGGILGRSVEFVVEDTKESNSINAVTAFQRILLNKEIRFLFGPSCTPAGLAVAPVAAKHPEILLISPSIGLREFNEAGPNIFKLWPYDEDGPRLLAEFAIEQNWRSAAVFSSQQAWELAQGRFFSVAFEKLGGKITEKVEPIQSINDLKTEAMKLIRSKPDVIVLTNYLQFDIAARELERQGWKGPKIASLMTGEKILSAAGALEGTVSYGYPPASPSYLDLFQKKFGREPWSISSDTAYDALTLLAKVINEKKSLSPELIAGELRKVRDYRGASGVFSIDEKGGVLRTPILYVVKGNHNVALETSAR